MKHLKIAGVALVASLVVVGAAAPAMASTDVGGSQVGTADSAPNYTDTTGNILVGPIGPSVNAGDISIATDGSGNITGSSFKTFTIPDQTFTSPSKPLTVKLMNMQMRVRAVSGSGQLTSDSATLNETGLEVDLSGSLCANYSGLNYCDNFVPNDPLRIYVTPTQGDSGHATTVVSASGVVQPDGSYDLSGSGFITVDNSTWTGTFLGWILNNDQLSMNLNMAPQSAAASARH